MAAEAMPSLSPGDLLGSGLISIDFSGLTQFIKKLALQVQENTRELAESQSATAALRQEVGDLKAQLSQSTTSEQHLNGPASSSIQGPKQGASMTTDEAVAYARLAADEAKGEAARAGQKVLLLIEQLNTLERKVASVVSGSAKGRAAAPSTGDGTHRDVEMALLHASTAREIAENAGEEAAQLVSETQQAAAELKDLRKRMAAAEAGIADRASESQHRLSDVTASIKTLQDRITGASARTETVVLRLDTRSAELRQEFLDRLTDQNNRLQIQYDKLHTTMDAASHKVETTAASLSTGLLPINQRLVSLVERVAQVERDALKAADVVSPADLEKALSRCNEAPRNRFTLLETHINHLEGRLEECMYQKADRADVALKADVERKLAQVQQDLEHLIHDLEKRMEDALLGKADIASITAVEQRLHTRASQLETALLQGLRTLSDKMAAAVALKADLQEMQDFKVHIKAAIADLRDLMRDTAPSGLATHKQPDGQVTLCLSCDQPVRAASVVPSHHDGQNGASSSGPGRSSAEGWHNTFGGMSSTELVGASHNARLAAEREARRVTGGSPSNLGVTPQRVAVLQKTNSQGGNSGMAQRLAASPQLGQDLGSGLPCICSASATSPSVEDQNVNQAGALGLALKEWAVTCAALASGDQTVVLRKGGLREPTFKPAGKQFLLFPTSFHSEVSLMTPEASQKYAKELASDPKQLSTLHLDTVAEVTGAWTTTDPAMLERLSGFHVWAPAFLDTRLRWRPKQPVTILELRAWRLAAPLVTPPQDKYWGCFSWVTLDDRLAPGAWEQASPALDDEAFAAKQRQLRRALQSLDAVQELPV
ncbi:hypothetical protein WJX72_009055 [[Myrmecia] bisecta]|uniref:Uncharacterized protein n=1 Tax=[Myrmecia] bisecta TaxID=41462 RepID=A0AAW1QG05_9CHLO